MTEQEYRYEQTVCISISTEEFQILEAAAKKRRLSVEEYLKKIIDEIKKLNGELPGEKNKKTKLDFLEQGDKLLNRLCKLDEKYRGVSRRDEGYTWCCLPAGKEEILDKINRDLEFVHSRVQLFCVPDLTHEKWDDPGMNLEAERQSVYAMLFPGKTYKEIRAAALRSYKRLERDFLVFWEVVRNTPDEVFDEEILHV